MAEAYGRIGADAKRGQTAFYHSAYLLCYRNAYHDVFIERSYRLLST